jgi:hypothetical protein
LRLKSAGHALNLYTSAVFGAAMRHRSITEVPVAQTVRQRQSRLIPILDSDGRAHPLQNTLAAVTAVLGALAIITTIWPGLHLISSWAGLVGIFTGGWGHFISATTAERFVLIIGLGASAVGFFLGMAHGGLFGGLLG